MNTAGRYSTLYKKTMPPYPPVGGHTHFICRQAQENIMKNQMKDITDLNRYMHDEAEIDPRFNYTIIIVAIVTCAIGMTIALAPWIDMIIR